ncbi:hypothetical protein BRD01_05520 [Halobacteriales archaeon QS_8_65_32]|nr:MAG: hypothetical protein BRD01_05520 [Halobacteriales archaeon QS_8_65_32]
MTLSDAERKDLENLRLRLRTMSGIEKLEAIENDEWDEAETTEAIGKSVAYGTAADHLAAVLEGSYERMDVHETIEDLPQQWTLNLLRYAAYSERGED